MNSDSLHDTVIGDEWRWVIVVLGLAATAIMVGPNACASRTLPLHPSRGPASRLSCTDAVDVIIAAPAVPVLLAVKKRSIAW